MTYNNKTEDELSRQIRPVLFNTAKDGSGLWYFALVDSSGRLVESNSPDILTALQIIDNFISGSRGLVTEDNSAAIKTAIEAVNIALQSGGISQTQFANMITALQLIDNFISGSRGLVTEDNSATIKTAVEAINTALQTSGISQVQFAAMVTALQLIDNAVSGNSLATFRTTATLLNSGVKSADALIKGSAGDIYWISISDTAALSLELNNSTDNSGTDVWAGVFPANCYAHYILDPPIECSAGIYLDVSTATCKVVVGYK